MKLKPPLPPVDVESYVPAAIPVVRRSAKLTGLFLQERRGASGEVQYLAGTRQHIFYCFLDPLRSEVVADGDTKLMQYREGEGRFTPAGYPVCFRWTGDVRALLLGFEPWFFEKVAAELGVHTAFGPAMNTRKLPSAHSACVLMRKLSLELDNDNPIGSPQLIEGVARAIAVLLLREYAQLPAARHAEPAPPVAVLRAVELMRKRIAESITLEEMAEVAGLSPFHFARQFKAATGHPPHEFLIRLRVDRAQELISRCGRDWTMAAVAQESGFADQSHMARHFRRVLGVSPREFSEARGRMN